MQSKVIFASVLALVRMKLVRVGRYDVVLLCWLSIGIGPKSVH